MLSMECQDYGVSVGWIPTCMYQEPELIGRAANPHEKNFSYRRTDPSEAT